MQHETAILTVRKSKKKSTLLFLLGTTVALTIIALGLISTPIGQAKGWTTGIAILIATLSIPINYIRHPNALILTSGGFYDYSSFGSFTSTLIPWEAVGTINTDLNPRSISIHIANPEPLNNNAHGWKAALKHVREGQANATIHVKTSAMHYPDGHTSETIAQLMRDLKQQRAGNS